MTKKTTPIAYLLIAIGIACASLGSLALRDNMEARGQAKKFESLVSLSKDAVNEKRYQDLPNIISLWHEIGHPKSLYNQGWINLHLLEHTGDINPYLSARANFRESLRQDPSFFDAKYNLVYLDNLAKLNKINPDEVPLSPNAQPNGLPNGSDSRLNPEDSNKISQDNLQNKITGVVDTPTLGGEPLNLDSLPNTGEDGKSPPPQKY